jgi:hypothetical protein
MASTGTATYTITLNNLIKSSMRAIRVIQEGQTPSSQQYTDATEVLNILIKNMQSRGLALWTYQLIAIPCSVNKYTYTLGPTGADITVQRPLRLMDGAYIRYLPVGSTTPFDTPLRVISRLEYLQFGSKTTQGTPNSIYYDSQFNTATATSASTGYGTLYVYVNPIDAQHTIYGNFQRQLFDMTNSTDEFDFPSEAFLALRWGLAAELCDEYEVPEDRIRRVESKAKYYADQLEDWSVETAPMMWTPDWSATMRR